MLEKTATFSQDRIYRYSLSRTWNTEKPFVVFIGLNPSTADENFDDPTIRRCMRYAGDWQFGGLVMLNLFAYRSTDPIRLRKVEDPIGPQNDIYIRFNTKLAGLTIVAWGTRGDYLGRDSSVLNFLRSPYCLALSKNGAPRHPLYLRGDLEPVEFIAKLEGSVCQNTPNNSTTPNPK